MALNKPLIIHTRNAQQDTLQLLREGKAQQCGGVIHCFTEDLAFAQAAMELGFYISISGIVTFRQATDLKEVVKALPLDRLLIETDSPYLAQYRIVVKRTNLLMWSKSLPILPL